MKKLLAVLLALLCCTACFSAALAADTGVSDLAVNPYGGARDAMDTIPWRLIEGTYFLFLPANTDISKATVYYTAAGSVQLDGVNVASGGNAAVFIEGTHILTCGAASYTLTVCISAGIPAVFITTESGSLDYLHKNKDNKEPGDIRVYEDGKKTLDSELKQIKGRGNSTWYYPKKPYNIKFDKKTDMFGMGKAKKWTLLANYFDYSLIHNVFGWEFARAFGLPYTSEYKHVDLYINGDYLGNYVICESVEIGENRVDIADLEKANEKANPDTDLDTLPRGGTGKNNTVQPYTAKSSRKWIEIPKSPADITGGYLLEYEYGSRYNDELCGFVTKNGQPVVIKSPELASKAEVTYIADYLDAGTEALYSETGYNAAGKHYSEYFDVDSLVNMYLLQELSMNFDAAFSSFYAFKPAGNSKIVFGPIWDMDNAFGSRSANMNVALINTNLWWANQLAYNGIPTVLAAANRHAEIRAAARARWTELRGAGVFETVNATVSALKTVLTASAAMNGLRWNHFKTADRDGARTAWEKDADKSIRFVADRTSSLDKGFGAKGAYVYYDLNGVTEGSWATVSRVVEIGGLTKIREFEGNGNPVPPEGKRFYAWNTKKDGTGTFYKPDENMRITEECTVLYAVWILPGDVDFSGEIEPADARLALRISLGLMEDQGKVMTERNVAAADFNGDEDVVPGDARLILRRSLGLPD